MKLKNNVRFYRNIYVSESIKDDIWQIKWKLKHHKHMLGVYVIVLPEHSDELEFYHCEYLQQEYYKRHVLYIVGIASGWKDACMLVARMIMDIAEQSGSYCIGKYIRNQVSNY